MSLERGENLLGLENVPLVRIHSGSTPSLIVPAVGTADSGQPSASTSESTLDKLSELPRPSRPPSRQARSTSRPRRSSSLADSEREQNSAKSLPQPLPPSSGDSERAEIQATGRPSYGSAPASLAPANSLQQSVRQAFGRLTGAHESSSGRRSRRNSVTSQHQNDNVLTSPRMNFWPLNRIHTRDPVADPFVTRDPYRFRTINWPSILTRERKHLHAFANENLPSHIRQLLIQIYRHLLLRLPSIYFSRVSRIFEEAEVSRVEMQRMIADCATGKEFPVDWGPNTVSPALCRFRKNWEGFIDSVMREWKTLNIVSALLLSAILTMFQVNDAAQQVVTRSASLISLICATWSLIYGGVYIMRFGTMRGMYKATSWASEAQKSETSVFWNVWVLLALPAVWLTWSMIAFFTAVISFVWTAGSSDDNPQAPSARIFLIPRILITVLFVLGLVYFFLVVHTFSNYGAMRPRLNDADFDPSAPSSPEGAAREGVLHRVTSPAHGIGAAVAATSRRAQAAVRGHASPRSNSNSPRMDVEKGEALNVEESVVR